MTHQHGSTENQRLRLQASLDVQKSQRERNQLGQFATPTQLANDILGYAATLLEDKNIVRFLDPAFGTGSFYSALLNTFPSNRIERSEGYEIDAHYGAPAIDLWQQHPLQIRLQDFTCATPPTPDERFNLIICNPPYVRHHHIGADDKLRLKEATEAACGVRINGLSGLYCYFMALAHSWLSEGGVSGWLVPSEFMDVNYGSVLKQYLLEKVTLLHIHRFDPNEVQFDDALVSSSVVWFRNEKPQARHKVKFSYGGTMQQPKIVREIAADTLVALPKWTQITQTNKRMVNPALTLSDLFSVKRGIATGDNKFFILSRHDIEQKGLPLHLFQPILPNARYLPENEIFADDVGNPILDRQLFVLDCRLPEEIIKQEYPALWDYLQTGIESVASRYLCQSRTKWYFQEKRLPAPFICTYMGRDNGSSKKQPFRFILNHSNAIAGNIYLMLYPKPLVAKLLLQKPAIARKILEFLNSIAPETLLNEGRVYGGGLYKLEPKELANVPACEIADLFPSNFFDAPPVRSQKLRENAAA
jgi:adenine-specific DNA-methyltransferase